MTTIVLIEKTGSIKELKAKKISTDTLYSKCGFRSNKNFEMRTTWDVTIDDEHYAIELWCRDYGKAGTENKYDFPPPIDKELYFGTCCLIRKNGEDIIEFSASEWNKVYEKLFGGFEDIQEDESKSEDELDVIPKELKTKSGYLKDGFVVGTDSDSDSEVGLDDTGSDEEDSTTSEIQIEIYNYSSDGD